MKQLIIIPLASIVMFVNHLFFPAMEKEDEFIYGKPDSVVSLTFGVVGDIMCHSTQFNYARVESESEKDTFDFKPVYREIERITQNVDVMMGNLETVFAGEDIEYLGYPFFNTPDDFLRGIKHAGFDILFTANNHQMDRGKEGLVRTLNKLREANIHHAGTNRSQNEADSMKVYNINDINIAVLAYTYSTNGVAIPEGGDYLIDTIYTPKIKSDITKAKEAGAEVVITYFHFGKEYDREPNAYQREVVSKAVEYGADVILGSHTHTIQPVDFMPSENSRFDSVFVAYGLGNFVSNQRWRYSDCSVILNFTLNKNLYTDSLFVSDISYTPLWVFKGETDNGSEYIILPSEITEHDSLIPTYVTESDLKLMKESYTDTREIITKYKHIPMKRVFGVEQDTNSASSFPLE